jgi:hypothetical protein
VVRSGSVASGVEAQDNLVGANVNSNEEPQYDARQYQWVAFGDSTVQARRL